MDEKETLPVTPETATPEGNGEVATAPDPDTTPESAVEYAFVCSRLRDGNYQIGKVNDLPTGSPFEQIAAMAVLTAIRQGEVTASMTVARLAVASRDQKEEQRRVVAATVAPRGILDMVRGRGRGH